MPADHAFDFQIEGEITLNAVVRTQERVNCDTLNFSYETIGYVSIETSF